MKIGLIEVSGIRRIVDGKACWERYTNRWVKYLDGKAIDGRSDAEMHTWINTIVQMIDYRSGRHVYRVWIHGETINVEHVPRKRK
jgi:hypothetical protein